MTFNTYAVDWSLGYVINRKGKIIIEFTPHRRHSLLKEKYELERYSECVKKFSIAFEEGQKIGSPNIFTDIR